MKLIYRKLTSGEKSRKFNLRIFCSGGAVENTRCSGDLAGETALRKFHM